MGEHLAAIGVASHFHQAVGDNHERIVLAFRTALARSDGVIVCGGLGPTHDDITRDAIAEVMNVPLHRDEEVVERIRTMFNVPRVAQMPDSNLRQADVPEGATVIPQTKGTAPGLICPVGHKVVYAVPGVPYEMSDMFERAIAPDLDRRMAERGETTGVIASRVIRTWGMSESALAETLAAHIDRLDGTSAGRRPPMRTGPRPPSPSWPAGSRGSRCGSRSGPTTRPRPPPRSTPKRPRSGAILADAAGDVVFGIDDEAIEDAVARPLAADGLTLGLAESLTGGLAASRLVNVPGASRWFRGSVVSYASEVKFDVLGVPEGPVVSEEAARAMADGARSVLGADVGLSMTGVAGPDPQDGQPPGTVFVGLARPGRPPRPFALHGAR